MNLEESKSLNILHVIAINGIGGAENLLIELLPALKNQNNKVYCIIFHRNSSGPEAHFIGDNLKNLDIKVQYRRYSKIFDKNIFSFLLNFIKANELDIIHSHLKHADIWFAILKWQKKVFIPVISTLHGYRDSYHNKYGLFWKKKETFTFYYWITKFICIQLDGFIMISQGIKSLYQKAGLIKKKNVSIIYHGTTLDKVDVFKTKPSFNYEIALPGRLVKFKGHKYLIEAAKSLRQKFPAISVHFYGSGPELNNLKQLVARNDQEQYIFFHGFVNDIINRISQHDIAVIPSIGEPFGLVFFDAFKADLPVVAFNLAAGNEIIEDGYNGLLAEPFNVDSLSNLISKLFIDQHLRMKLKEHAKEKLQLVFSIERMAKGYIFFYQTVINNTIKCVE